MSITLNPYLMLLVFIVFMLLIYLLNQWLYKPMFTFMKNRDESIQRDLQSTQGHKNDISQIEKEISEILQQARKEAAQILDTATREAKATYESKINSKKMENEAKLAQYKEELQTQKAELRSDLIAQLPLFRETLKTKLKQI